MKVAGEERRREAAVRVPAARGRAIAPRLLAAAQHVAAGARAAWCLGVVLAGFAAAALIVPTLAPVATTDDWAYSRLVQIFSTEGRLVVFPVIAATAVAQTWWGSLFAVAFGPTLGVTRLSTVVLVGLSGVALYGLCRRLGVDRPRAALGTAAYLFNPLVFVLAYTFMTDPTFTALLVISTALYAGGLSGDRDGRAAGWMVVAGSAAAALAFLTRQQGILIAPAVLTFLLIGDRRQALPINRPALRRLAQVAILPVLTLAGYYLWLRFVNDVPQVQRWFLREVSDHGWEGTWWLLRRLTVVELIYLGFFALPVVAAALPAMRRMVIGVDRRGWLLALVWAGALVAGAVSLWVAGTRMPIVGQFVGAGGLGPADVLGGRPPLLTPGFRDLATLGCVAASLGLALIAARGIAADASPRGAVAGLVLTIGLFQVAGILPPSYHYIGWTAGSLDRYLLPLVPLTICLALWALRGVRLSLATGWLVVALLAAFSVAGTRDYLVFLRSVWTVAEEAVAAGVPLDRLEAGSGWDGYHLYEYSVANGIREPVRQGGPWWVSFYAPATDSTYVVATRPLTGYVIVAERSYSSWLQRAPTPLYLLRRAGAPWPPAPAVELAAP